MVACSTPRKPLAGRMLVVAEGCCAWLCCHMPTLPKVYSLTWSHCPECMESTLLRDWNVLKTLGRVG